MTAGAYDCLVGAARSAYREKDYATSLAYSKRLLAAGNDLPAAMRVSALTVQAQALFQLGRFDDMYSSALEAQELARSLGGPDGAAALEAQNLVAVALRNLGRVREALATYQDLVARRERVDGPAGTEMLRAKNNYGSALRDSGDLAGARALLAEVHAARLQGLGPADPQTILAWHNLKTVEWERLGDERTLRQVEDALPAQQAALGPEHAEISRLKSLLASMLWSQGRLPEARALFAEVLEVRRRRAGEGSGPAQEAARNLAMVTLQLGDSEGALAILDAARRSSASKSDFNSRLRDQLEAFVHLQRGETEAAHALLGTGPPAGALKGRTPTELSDAVLRAVTLSRRGAHDEAIALQREVREEDERRLGPSHPRTLMSLRALASLQMTAARDGDARETLEAFVERSERRDGVLASASDLHRRQLAQGIEAHFQWAGYKTYVRLLAAADPARALEVAELAKGRSLAESGAVSGRGQVARAEAREAAWRLAKAEEALAANEPGSNAYLQAASQRAEAEAKLRALRPAAGTTKRYGLADRLATLPRGAVFIDYVVDGDRVVALLAGKNLPVTGIDLGRVERLDETVEALRRLTAATDPAIERVWRTTDGFRWALARPANAIERAKDATQVVRFLSQKLIDPLVPHLRKSSRWIVSPDGPLAFLPFELLEIGGKRVVENHEITIAPSLAVITAGKARAARVLSPGANREFLGIGVSRAGGDWPELPAAEREVAAVANLFPADRRVTLTGAQATEAAFAKLESTGDLERFRYIHIASHAFLSPRGSSLSGVVLAKDPADASNDGIVTAAEWPVYRLRSDLVVLSACDTGRGTLLAGEGVMGLPYALLQAGTRDVLLTLWPVSDAAAADFMPRFYGRLRKGVPPARALRETKVELARGRGPHAAPTHWAAFVLHGVP